MATKGIKIFFAISIVFYLLIVFYSGYSIYTERENAYNTSTEVSIRINSEIESAYSIDYSFSTDYFIADVNKLFNIYPSLKGVLIYSDRGPEYIKLNDSSILSNPPGSGSLAGWEPEIFLKQPFFRQYENKLYFDNGVSIKTVLLFNLMDRNLFFPALRNALIASLIYIFIIIIVFLTRKQSNISYESLSESAMAAETDESSITPVSTEPALSTENISQNDSSQVSTGLYSERSGLVWEHFLGEKLEAELKRAASFDQDSCLAFISVISPSGFIPYRNISELIVEHFTYKDLAFEAGEHTFCVIIPEKDIDEGLNEIERFRKSLVSRFPDSSYKVYAGLTSRNSRLLSENRMIHEAKAALSRAESEPDSTTISFRTDLNKYREYIASTL